MSRLAPAVTSLLIALTFIGCYTQIGYYELPRPTRETSSYRQEENEKPESEPEELAQIKPESELSETDDNATEEDDGYYGRREPTYTDGVPRYYYHDDYRPYPYYSGYYPTYPYHGYQHYPYYNGYYDYYGHYGYRHHYSVPHSKISDLHFGRGRSQSHRSIRSSTPSSRRPNRSSMTGESKRAPARSSSGS